MLHTTEGWDRFQDLLVNLWVACSRLAKVFTAAAATTAPSTNKTKQAAKSEELWGVGFCVQNNVIGFMLLQTKILM